MPAMCNEYENPFSLWEEYAAMMAAADLGTTTDRPPLDLPRTTSTRVGDLAPVLRASGNVVEAALMKFGFPPPRPNAAPVFNYRSEGRRFGDSNRCLIPARAFYEFTGSRYPKTKHRIAIQDTPWFAIAGLWRPGPEGDAFTMFTIEPGADVAPVHGRQVVVLPPGDWAAWLYTSPSPRAICSSRHRRGRLPTK